MRGAKAPSESTGDDRKLSLGDPNLSVMESTR